MVYYKYMKNAIRKSAGGKRPGAGRPATGQDPVTAVRLSKEMRAAIDAWRRKRPDLPTRSEAIRRLVGLGLKMKAK
jgi:hypothetical protein